MLAVAARSSAPATTRQVAGVARLSLHDFRNYASLRVELDGRPVVLTGDNGAGKTNLLEAVSLLTPGRGLRRAAIVELDRHGGGRWAVGASLRTADCGCTVETGRVEGSGRRQVIIDGAVARGPAELGAVLGAVWLTPAQDRLFMGPPGDRRRFVDRLVLALDPAHASRIAAYDRTLLERTALLRDRRRDTAWLAAVERRLAEQGIAVAAARLDAVHELDTLVRQEAGAWPRPHVRLEGEVEGWLGTLPALEAEDRLAAALAASRESDAQAGGAEAGPHRCDLLVLDEQGEPAQHASTGRQKLLLLAIVLAQARLRRLRLGDPPLLLLDEVAAHLDRRRRHDLLERVVELEAQAWLTGTDAATFAPLGSRAQHFTVIDATLERR